VSLPSLHPQNVPEESFGAISEEYLFEFAESMLTVVTDEVFKPHIIFEISEACGQIVFFGMQR
jgi:hypothetical protein